jgi:hypothetical protein
MAPIFKTRPVWRATTARSTARSGQLLVPTAVLAWSPSFPVSSMSLGPSLHVSSPFSNTSWCLTFSSFSQFCDLSLFFDWSLLFPPYFDRFPFFWCRRNPFSPYSYTDHYLNPFHWFVVGRSFFDYLDPTNHTTSLLNHLKSTVKKHNNIRPPTILSTRLGRYLPAQTGWILAVPRWDTHANTHYKVDYQINVVWAWRGTTIYLPQLCIVR